MLIYLLAITDPEGRSKFMRLYFHNQGLMYSVAKRILRSDALAEDALQEAFFAIARNIEKVHDPESPQTRGFCVVIARNMALTLLRKQQREIPTDWEDMQTVPAPGDDGLATLWPLCRRSFGIFCCCAMTAATAQRRSESLWACPQHKFAGA